MDLQLLKNHLEELKKLIESEESPNPLVFILYNPVNAVLNSQLFTNIEQQAKAVPPKTVPLVAYMIERKKRQALEKLFKQIQESFDCPAKVKIRIAEVQQEMAQISDELKQDSRRKATAEGQ